MQPSRLGEICYGSPVYYLTIVAYKRNHICANSQLHVAFIAFAERAADHGVTVGRYVLMPEIFESLQSINPGSGGEIQLTDALRHLLRTRPIYAYRFEGTRYDAGDKLGFLKATVEYALRRHDLGGPFREYLQGLKL